ncbi:MAG: hypothetical protein UU47_C0004G0046 [candidate division TM6 bacterium GW2011_GWE2_41_16]|nr:MAG: hypothetical protein UU47_C0004G0046 [candidate division TM6 bacterium GW2011_GWE2_41_16]
MKKGFTLLELVIVIGLSSFVFTILYRAITSVQKNFSSCVIRSEKLSMDVPVYDLIQMDVGAIVPFPPFEPKPQKAQEPDKKEPQAQPGQQNAATPTEPAKEKDKKQERERVPALLMERAGDNTAYVMMITNNSFPSYIPHLRYPVRVIYKIQKGGPLNDSFVRYESNDVLTPIKDEKGLQAIIQNKATRSVTLYDKVPVWRIEAIVYKEAQKKNDRLSVPVWGTETAKKSTKRTVPDALHWHMEYVLYGRPGELDVLLPVYGMDQKPMDQKAQDQKASGKQTAASGAPSQNSAGQPAQPKQPAQPQKSSRPLGGMTIGGQI